MFAWFTTQMCRGGLGAAQPTEPDKQGAASTQRKAPAAVFCRATLGDLKDAEEHPAYLADMIEYLNYGSLDGFELALCTPAPKRYEHLQPLMEAVKEAHQQAKDQRQASWDRFQQLHETALAALAAEASGFDKKSP